MLAINLLANKYLSFFLSSTWEVKSFEYYKTYKWDQAVAPSIQN